MNVTFEYHPFLALPECNQGYQPPVENEEGSVTCHDLRRKLIAMRVYFVVIILNFLFITITTSCFVYRYMSLGSKTNPTRQWQDYSLKKRDLLGSILGAVGHFVFSSGIFIHQVVYTSYSCELYIWCPMVGFYFWMYAMLWRTHRLHMLIQTSQLQKHYYYRYDSSPEVYQWFNQQKKAMKKISRYHTAFLGLSISVLIAVIVLGESLGLRAPGYTLITKCQFTYGNYVVLGMVSGFFLLIVPFIVWYIRDDDDAHGIRQEIWVTLSVGVPCFIAFIVWQVIFAVPTQVKPISPRGVFGPVNWIVFMTTSSHIMSIVIPMIKTISVPKDRKLSKAEKRRNTGNTLDIDGYVNMLNGIGSKRKASIKSTNRATTQSASAQSHSKDQEEKTDDFQLDLTVKSLNHALITPSLLKVLQSWAIKDFTVENILFYDQYLKLVRMIGNRVYTDDCDMFHNIDSVNFIVQESLDEDAIGPCDEILNTPFEDEEVPKLVLFYDTFVKDQAPLQVNITHRSRSLVDSVMAPLSKQKTERKRNKPGIPTFLAQMDNIASNGIEEDDSVKIDVDDHDSIHSLVTSTAQSKDKSRTKDSTDIIPLWQTSKVPNPHPTLEIFEEARKEVFWNIFNGLFPKVVEANSS
ncbi:hypothetical protein EDC96DRAFT_564335 [Choanephora cucurbitarum]|nr:hypothetical protein EDC96DRAFT_564335 [Choanephora cucurbitarum]